jgi:hypothetical protein
MLEELQEVIPADAPLHVTMLVPCVAPKFAPVTVTFAPNAAGLGETPVISGPTVKLTPSLSAPPTVATTGPEVADAGTEVVMDVLDHVAIVAFVPLKVTVLVPWVVPKPVPAIVTVSPVFPELGVRAVTLNPEETVKLMPLLVALPTTTTTLPVVAPLGTGTTMPVSLQPEGVATVLLNLTLLVPWVWPKAAPVMVTVAPIPPFAGEMLVIPGPALTEKATPVLGPLGVVTTTLPVVAPSGTVVAMLVEVALVSVAVFPLNVTVFDASVDEKLVPVMVTGNPAGPEVADKVVIVARATTVKATPLLAGSPGIVTTTFPVVAPDGTSTSTSLGVQSVGVAAVPLNLTVLLPWLLPKLEPKIATDCPTEPELLPVGVDRNEIEGGDITVKVIGLLAAPPE